MHASVPSTSRRSLLTQPPHNPKPVVASGCRTRQQARASASHAANHTVGMRTRASLNSHHKTIQERRIRNKEHARRSRERQRARMHALKQQVSELLVEKKQLSNSNEVMQKELQQLQSQKILLQTMLQFSGNHTNIPYTPLLNDDKIFWGVALPASEEVAFNAAQKLEQIVAFL